LLTDASLLVLNRELARFIWARVVQNALNVQKAEDAKHQIRTQSKRLLPSGGQPQQFYDHPEDWNGAQCLIPIPQAQIDLVIQEYVPSNLFQFCSVNVHEAATATLDLIGNPVLVPAIGWNVFSEILPIVMVTLLPQAQV
jgi:hypothetical protein